MSKKEVNQIEEQAQSTAEESRRSFIKKYGKLAAITPIAASTLMSPSTSAAPKSCKKNGNFGC
ncbi:hypothetical protein ACFSJY_13545 [Thalassotalea euphylliae]|uniref:hypothetical protein n=1 Tax=Thalassotalea euphylliae TaxID=1655234 RepID=UPI0036451FDE